MSIFYFFSSQMFLFNCWPARKSKILTKCLTSALIMDHSEVRWRSPTIDFTSNQIQFTRRIQFNNSMFHWVLFRVLKKSVVPVPEERTRMVSIFCARTWGISDSLTNRKIIQDEPSSVNFRTLLFHWHTVSSFLPFITMKRWRKMGGMFMSRLLSSGGWDWWVNV